MWKNKHNHSDPVKTAQKNYVAVAFLLLVLEFVFVGVGDFVLVGYLLPFLALYIVAGFLLKKRRMAGVYVGWLVVLFGLISAIKSSIVALVFIAYIAYWNYKAQEALKKERLSSIGTTTKS